MFNVNTANALCDVTKQVLTYAQQSRERAYYEQAALVDRMQEYRQQMEQENQRSFSDVDSLATGHRIQAVGRSSHKLIEATSQSGDPFVLVLFKCFHNTFTRCPRFSALFV